MEDLLLLPAAFAPLGIAIDGLSDPLEQYVGAHRLFEKVQRAQLEAAHGTRHIPVWHNNHHAFPTSARHGLRWWQFDVTYLIIWAMSKIGLARDVRIPSRDRIAAKRCD